MSRKEGTNMVVALDIGTSKVVALIGEDEDDQIDFLVDDIIGNISINL